MIQISEPFEKYTHPVIVKPILLLSIILSPDGGTFSSMDKIMLIELNHSCGSIMKRRDKHNLKWFLR